MNIFRRRLGPYKYYRFPFFAALFRLIHIKNYLANGSSGRCSDAISDGTQLNGRINLAVKQLFYFLWSYPGHSSLLVNNALVYHIGGNLYCCFCRALSASRLQNVKLTPFHCKFNILHISKVLFKQFSHPCKFIVKLQIDFFKQ